MDRCEEKLCVGDTHLLHVEYVGASALRGACVGSGYGDARREVLLGDDRTAIDEL